MQETPEIHNLSSLSDCYFHRNHIRNCSREHYAGGAHSVRLANVTSPNESSQFTGPRRVAAFFDLDKTVIATSSAHAFGREFMSNGLISPTEAFELSMAKASFMFSGQTSSQMDSSRDQLASMVTGWDVEQVRQIAAEALHHVVTPAIYAEARELIEQHRAAGHEVIIVSASARMLVDLIAAELGVEQVAATEMEVAGGKFTGNISFYCKGPGKVEAMERLARENHYDLAASYAYSDSGTDIPMLEAVGNPTAVNPDRQMKKRALENGWEIRSFRNPVPLFQPPTARELTIGSSVFAGIAAAAAGGLWWAMRTRRGTA